MGRTSEAATVTEAEAMKGVTGLTAQTPTHQGHARSCRLNVHPARQPQRPGLSP